MLWFLVSGTFSKTGRFSLSSCGHNIQYRENILVHKFVDGCVTIYGKSDI